MSLISESFYDAKIPTIESRSLYIKEKFNCHNFISRFNTIYIKSFVVKYNFSECNVLFKLTMNRLTLEVFTSEIEISKDENSKLSGKEANELNDYFTILFSIFKMWAYLRTVPWRILILTVLILFIRSYLCLKNIL